MKLENKIIITVMFIVIAWCCVFLIKEGIKYKLETNWQNKQIELQTDAP